MRKSNQYIDENPNLQGIQNETLYQIEKIIKRESGNDELISVSEQLKIEKFIKEKTDKDISLNSREVRLA